MAAAASSAGRRISGWPEAVVRLQTIGGRGGVLACYWSLWLREALCGRGRSIRASSLEGKI